MYEILTMAENMKLLMLLIGVIIVAPLIVEIIEAATNQDDEQ